MPLDLVTIEHSPNKEVLTQPAAEVAFPLSADEKQLIEEMKDMVIKIQGVGLAAPQVGVAKQIIVYVIDESAMKLRGAQATVPLTVLINPTYTPHQEAKLVYDWEGCFSVAETTGKVPRYDKIVYSAKTPEGHSFSAVAEGFIARVLQHEIDHIKGLTILNRFNEQSVKGHPDEMMIVRYQELSPEQRDIYKKFLDEKIKTLAQDDTAFERIQKIKNRFAEIDQEEQRLKKSLKP